MQQLCFLETLQNLILPEIPMCKNEAEALILEIETIKSPDLTYGFHSGFKYCKEAVIALIRAHSAGAVKLEECCREYMRVMHPSFNPDHELVEGKGANWKLYIDGIKAVLEAAGVPYVE